MNGRTNDVAKLHVARQRRRSHDPTLKKPRAESGSETGAPEFPLHRETAPVCGFIPVKNVGFMLFDKPNKFP